MRVGALLGDLGEDLRVTNEEVLVVADLDRVATPAGEEDLVAVLDGSGDNIAVLVGGTGAGGDDASFRKGGGSSGGGDEETGGGLGLGLESLDQNAVEKGDDRLDRANGGLSGLHLSETVGMRVDVVQVGMMVVSSVAKDVQEESSRC